MDNPTDKDTKKNEIRPFLDVFFIPLYPKNSILMNKDCIVNDYRNELKERILEYSEKEFYANGVKQVKMDNIANYLSISKRTLYEIYPTKEDLLLECLKNQELNNT